MVFNHTKMPCFIHQMTVWYANIPFLKNLCIVLRLAYIYQDAKASVLADLYLPILPHCWEQMNIDLPYKGFNLPCKMRGQENTRWVLIKETKSTDFYLFYRNFYQRVPFFTTLTKTHRGFWQFCKLCEFYQDLAIYCPRYISSGRKK